MKGRVKERIRKVSGMITSLKIWVAEMAAEVSFSLGLSPLFGPDEQSVEQLSEQLSEQQPRVTTIPMRYRPLSQGSGHGSGYRYHSVSNVAAFDDPARDSHAAPYLARGVGVTLVSPEYGRDTYYHQCDDLYSDIGLLSPEPIKALSEQRRVPVTIEYLNSVPACYPHTGLEREFLLIRVRRGAKRIYRVLIPAGVAHSPIIEQASLGEAVEFFKSGELVAIGKSQPLKLAKLVSK